MKAPVARGSVVAGSETGFSVCIFNEIAARSSNAKISRIATAHYTTLKTLNVQGRNVPIPRYHLLFPISCRELEKSLQGCPLLRRGGAYAIGGFALSKLRADNPGRYACCNPFKLPASRRFTEHKSSTRPVFTSRQLAVNGYYGFRLNPIIASRNIFLAFFIASRNTESMQTKGEQP